MTADMSVAPEIARLAQPVLLLPAQPPITRSRADRPHSPDTAATAATPLTLGALARELREIAAAPQRWWGLVRFDRNGPAKITVEECASYQAWLVILPPGDAGQSCDCDVATMIAGEATEGTPSSAGLRPGTLRVHGQRHRLRGHGTGYSISLHARAHRPAKKT